MTVTLLLSFSIDMYSEGLADLNEMFILYPFDPPGVKEANIALMKEKATNRYFPAFEKVGGSCSDFKSVDIRVGVVAYTCNPRTQEAKTGRQPGILNSRL